MKVNEVYQKVEASLAPLGVLGSLVNLSLEESCGLTDGHLSFLQNFKNLKSLSLKNCRRISDNGMGFVVSLTKLEFLDISGCNLTPAGFLELSRTSSPLRRLMIRDCKALSDSALLQFSNFPLIELNVSNCKRLTDDGMEVRNNNLRSSF